MVNEGELYDVYTYFGKYKLLRKIVFSIVAYGKYGSKTQHDVFNTNTVLTRILMNKTGPASCMCVFTFQSLHVVV